MTAWLLHSEWTKFRTVRGWAWGMVGALVTIVVVGLIGTAASNPNGATPLPVGPGGEAVNDSFYFVHQSLRGDGSITAQVISLTGQVSAGEPGSKPEAGLAPWAKAGIIVKQSDTQGSAYAAMMVTAAHGVRMQYDYTHDAPGLAGAASAGSPRWLRLTRSGDTITGYDSVNGTAWTEVGTTRLSGLSATVEVGMFTTTPEAAVATSTGTGMIPAVATGTFGQVAVAGQSTGSSWTGTQVGSDAGTSGSYLGNGSGKYTASGGTFALTGAGDIAPVVGGSAFASGRLIENFLVGGFAGLIVVIVIATGFITSEYRRGLLGLTLAASPNRGKVLAAKAAVVGLTSFAAGVAAAGIAIPIGEHQSRANGFAVANVPVMTEVRVILGTGLLLAAAGVLALAVGTLVRRSAVAITIPVVTLVLPYILATSGTLPAGAADWLLRVSPGAGFAIQQSLKYYAQVGSSYDPASGYFPLSPWAGLAVLCAYAAVAFTAAVIVIRRRDA
jgi:ABC-type transport system involved in multi-copper enzyme maturation permease subunit